ncbi:hypothetical protein ANTQUA_LOCUS5895 [Anthophora quadrimaculata]
MCIDEYTRHAYKVVTIGYLNYVSVKGAKAKVGKLIYDRVPSLQGWSATGQMHDADRALSPLMAAGPKLPSYRAV